VTLMLLCASLIPVCIVMGIVAVQKRTLTKT